MKKRVLSLLLVLSLLVSMPGLAFAGTADIKGYTTVNPLGLNSEMKLTNLKTPNGTWKNASIKVSEVQIDNVGYKKCNSLQEVRYSDSTLSKFDAVKVKVTYIFSGFSGNQNSLIKDNLLAKRIDAINSKGFYKDGGQFYSGFTNALYNKVEKYSTGGKVYKGEWFSKKMKDVNFSKPVTMTGYVYLVLDKGKTEGATVNFNLYPQKDSDKEDVYFVFNNKMIASKVKNTGSYIYGDNEVGIVKADFEMNQYYNNGSDEEAFKSVIKGYRVGTEKDPIIDMVMTKSVDTFETKEAVDQYIEDAAEKLADKYEIEKYKDNGYYVIQGISEGLSQYISIHLVNKGNYFYMFMIVCDINEKSNSEKLWESYKASNDLSCKEKDSNQANNDQPTTPKGTSTKETGNFVYGTSQYGTFTSPEQLYDTADSNPETLSYATESGDSWYILQFFASNKQSLENLDTNIKKMVPNAVIGKLDQDNITVYTDNSNPRNCTTVLMTVKNNQIYTFIIGMPIRKLSTQKVPVIKSYLISLGYTEDQAETMATSAVFK